MANQKSRRNFTANTLSMATKPNNEKKTVAKKSAPGKKEDAKKAPASSDVDGDEEDDDLDEEATAAKPVAKAKAGGKKKKADDDDDEEDDVEAEVEDEWEKPADDDNWDPDFEEFDVPKSKTKKAPGKKSGEEDDLKIDDDFKEFGLFNDADGGGDFDEEDDF